MIDWNLGLTPEQKQQLSAQGFLMVEDALPPEMVARLTDATDRIWGDALARGEATPGEFYQLRNCCIHDEALLDLVDWPTTAPLMLDVFNWNIQLSTSHLTVLPPLQGPAKPGVGWHRDGGTSAGEMAEPHPLLYCKIMYPLSDTRDPRSGSMRVVPGSHRLMGKPPIDPDTGEPFGAIDLRCKPGTAVLFEQRLYHRRGDNFSEAPRKVLFYGYSWRWLRPMDYVTQPQEILDRCDPIRRQLLGDYATQMAFMLPTDEDVPLRAIYKARQERTAAEPAAV